MLLRRIDILCRPHLGLVFSFPLERQSSVEDPKFQRILVALPVLIIRARPQ